MAKCSACHEPMNETNLPPCPPTSVCEHYSRTCLSCLSLWIDSQRVGNGWERVRCPNCPVTMTCTEVEQYSITESFVRHDKACTWADVKGEAQVKYAVEDATSEQAVRDISKLCPNLDCGARVQNIAGRDHVTCPQCYTYFCFECLVPYEDIERDGRSIHALNYSWYKSLSTNDLEDGSSTRDQTITQKNYLVQVMNWKRVEIMKWLEEVESGSSVTTIPFEPAERAVPIVSVSKEVTYGDRVSLPQTEIHVMGQSGEDYPVAVVLSSDGTRQQKPWMRSAVIGGLMGLVVGFKGC